MELRSLRYFVAVATHRHFGDAAATVHVAQPALSQAIARLERELGVTLFERTTRRVALTPAGEYFHAEATRILTDVDAMTEGVKHIADGTQGLLRVGFTGTSAFTQLARLARALRDPLPGVSLTVETDLVTPTQVERILAGRLDMGVLRGEVRDLSLVTRRLVTERTVAALPLDHRLNSAGSLSTSDFAAESFVAFATEGSSVNEALDASARAGGFSPRITHRAPGTAGVLALVAAGLGVAFVPESVRTMRPDGVVFRDVSGAAATVLSLAVRADSSSPIVRNALNALEASGFFDLSEEDA